MAESWSQSEMPREPDRNLYCPRCVSTQKFGRVLDRWECRVCKRVLHDRPPKRREGLDMKRRLAALHVAAGILSGCAVLEKVKVRAEDTDGAELTVKDVRVEQGEDEILVRVVVDVKGGE